METNKEPFDASHEPQDNPVNHEELTDIPGNEGPELTETEKIAEATDQPDEKSWEAKYHEMYDNYLRLYSEFDNFRKRSIRERSELIKTAGADVLRSLLPVLDDFDRAQKSIAAAADIESLKTGMELVHHKFRTILADKGLTEVVPTGEVFDAELHEAITQVPAPSEELKGKVMDVVEKGFKLNDKIIRYPKVVIYS